MLAVGTASEEKVRLLSRNSEAGSERYLCRQARRGQKRDVGGEG